MSRPSRFAAAALRPLSVVTAVASAGLMLALSSLVGCPQPECVAFNDCPTGQQCNASNVCVNSVPIQPTPGSPGVPQPDPVDGGTPSPSAIITTVQTDFLVPWIQPHPTDPTKFLVPQYVASSVDELRTLNTTTGQFESPAAYDLVAAVDGPCQIDFVREEPTLNNGETWVACNDGLRIFYNNNLAQPAQLSALPLDNGISVTAKGVNDFSRRVWFERGGTTIASYVVRPNQDGLFIPRLTDTLSGVSFTGVVGIVQLPNGPGVNGESIAVIDRGALADVDAGVTATTTRVVPLTHDTGTEIMRAHDSLVPLDLGLDAHTVIVTGPVNELGQPPAGNTPNIMVFEPRLGRARYFKLENGEEVLPVTNFETDETFRAEAPGPEERLIHAMSPDGTAVFYAIAGVAKVWRVPLAPGSDNDVTFYTLTDFNDSPTGVFPVSETEAWVATANERVLLRVRFEGR